MSSVPVANVVPLAGGSFVSGICFTLSIKALYEHGVHFDLFNDRGRQTILNLMCLIGGLCAYVSYSLNQTNESWIANDVVLFFLFTSVQYGLVIINHNSINRCNALLAKWNINPRNLHNICASLYILPLITLIPIWLSYVDTIPQEKAVNKSSYNHLVFKPLNIGVILATELFAVVTDVLLLQKVVINKEKKTPSVKNINCDRYGVLSILDYFQTDLNVSYACIWAILVVDVALKILIYLGYPVLFDSIVSLLTICVRGHANLQYGLNLQHIFKGDFKKTEEQKKVLKAVKVKMNTDRTENMYGIPQEVKPTGPQVDQSSKTIEPVDDINMIPVVEGKLPTNMFAELNQQKPQAQTFVGVEGTLYDQNLTMSNSIVAQDQRGVIVDQRGVNVDQRGVNVSNHSGSISEGPFESDVQVIANLQNQKQK
jgi:hypothetical protein